MVMEIECMCGFWRTETEKHALLRGELSVKKKVLYLVSLSVQFYAIAHFTSISL